jgi:carbon storage regulator
MLILTRKSGEDIFVDGEIRIVIKEIRGRQVRVGVEAPPEVSVYRGEIFREIREENEQAIVRHAGDAQWALEKWKQIADAGPEGPKED